MADGVKVDEGKGPTIAADEVGGQQVQRVKVQHGADGSATDASTASPLPVDDDASQVLLSAIKGLLEGTAVVKVTDNAGSLTVDAPLGTPVAVRLSDGAEGIGTTAKRLHVDDGGSTLSVDDGAGSLTVDSTALGTPAEAEASGEGGLIGIQKRIRKLLEGTGLIKVSKIEEALPAGTNNIGQTDPRGNKAHDEADAGNPIKTGGRARTALAAAVSQDDRSDFTADKHGRQLVTEYPRDQKGEGRLNLTNTTETTILEAPGASTRWVVTGIIVTNSSASVETKVEIKDDTTAKVIVHAGTKGGGAAPACPPGGFFIGGENKTVKVKCVTTGADVEVFVCGYKIPA